jgi:hypothetical protein
LTNTFLFPEKTDLETAGAENFGNKKMKENVVID